MFKEKDGNVEVYFICYKKKEMGLVESYYDEILNIHYWYFNAYLAYKCWKKKFRGLKMGRIGKMLLTVAASRYLLYMLENGEELNNKERSLIVNDLKKIEPILQKIVNKNNILLNL